MSPNTSPIPHKAIHPGLHLKEELATYGIKQNELAAETGIQPSQLNELLKGKRSITPDLAILFGAALERPAEWWNKLQADYNLDLARVEETTIKQVEAINTWKEIKKTLPISYFRKEHELSGNIVKDINHLLSILNFSSISEMESTLNKERPAGILFKKSGKLLEHAPYVNSWIRYVKYLSKNEQVSNFNFDCQYDLLRSLKLIFLGSNVKENLLAKFQEYGIKLIIKSKPDHAPLDGAAFWYDINPVIGLTLRHQRFDNLIFTVYHELGHIFLHLKQNKETSFVDSLEDAKINTSSQENEANEFARNSLIPDEYWKEFVFGKTKFSDESIQSFANKMFVPPQVVWGRLCFDGRIKYSTPSLYQKHNRIP